MNILNAITEVVGSLIEHSVDIEEILISDIPTKFLSSISDIVNEAHQEGRNFLYTADYVVAIIQFNDCYHRDLLQVLSHTECLKLIKGDSGYSQADIHIDLANSLKSYYTNNFLLSVEDVESINSYISDEVLYNNTNYDGKNVN